MGKDKEAGQAFEKAANIQTSKLNEPDDAANTLVEAFKVYKKTDPLDAARCLDVAINHCMAYSYPKLAISSAGAQSMQGSLKDIDMDHAHTFLGLRSQTLSWCGSFKES